MGYQVLISIQILEKVVSGTQSIRALCLLGPLSLFNWTTQAINSSDLSFN